MLSATGMRERMAQALKDKRKFLSSETTKKQASDTRQTAMTQAGATKRTGLEQAGQSLRQGRGFEQADKTAFTTRQETLADTASKREQTLEDTASKRGYEQETAGRAAGLDLYKTGGNIADVSRLYGSGTHGADVSQLTRMAPKSEYRLSRGAADTSQQDMVLNVGTGAVKPVGLDQVAVDPKKKKKKNQTQEDALGY